MNAATGLMDDVALAACIPAGASELRHIGVNANLSLHTPQKLLKTYECSHRLNGRCGSGSLHPCRAGELRDIQCLQNAKP